MKVQSILLFLTVLLSGCTASRETGGSSKKPLPIYQGPVIDMHVHAFSRETGGMFFGLEHPKTLREGSRPLMGVATPEEQKEATLEQFQANNIVKAMVTGGELWYDAAPETILIGGGLKPVDQLKKQFEEGKLQVMGELAPFYRGILADDPFVVPYFDLAQELGIPVGFHILPGGPNGGRYLEMQMLKGIRAKNANPLQIESVLVSHPEVKVYIMHGGWPYVEDLKALMYVHPQLYVDVSVINWILPEDEFHRYLQELVQAGFGDRIMFGSDQMIWPQTIKMGIDAINSAPFLSLQQKEDIFYNNAARFLELGEEEINRHKNR